MITSVVFFVASDVMINLGRSNKYILFLSRTVRLVYIHL
jgi:hypothetical protein